MVDVLKPLPDALVTVTKLTTIHPWSDSKVALDVHSASTANGSVVCTAATHGGANQQWCLIAAGDGTYHIQVAHSGLYLDVCGGLQTAGTKICQAVRQPDQRWRPIPHELHAGYYYLQSTKSKLYLYNAAPVGTQLTQGMKSIDHSWRFQLVTPSA